MIFFCSLKVQWIGGSKVSRKSKAEREKKNCYLYFSLINSFKTQVACKPGEDFKKVAKALPLREDLLK